MPGAWGMNYSVKCLGCKHEDLSWIPNIHIEGGKGKLDTMAHIGNCSSREVDTVDS